MAPPVRTQERPPHLAFSADSQKLRLRQLGHRGRNRNASEAEKPGSLHRNKERQAADSGNHKGGCSELLCCSLGISNHTQPSRGPVTSPGTRTCLKPPGRLMAEPRTAPGSEICCIPHLAASQGVSKVGCCVCWTERLQGVTTGADKSSHGWLLCLDLGPSTQEKPGGLHRFHPSGEASRGERLGGKELSGRPDHKGAWSHSCSCRL